jgi:hypothetical protein
MADKEACKEKAFSLKIELNQLRGKRENLIGNKEFTVERLSKAEAVIEELKQFIDDCEKKIAKLEQEKKKAAALKKFKEASKA